MDDDSSKPGHLASSARLTAAPTVDKRPPHFRKGAHVVNHARRGVIDPDCVYCRQAAAS